MESDEYPRLAEAEDRMWYHHSLRTHLLGALDRSGLPDDAVVLDAGCGTGGLLRHLGSLRPGWRCSGIDIEPAACTFARQRDARADIICGSVNALPFEAETFDAVVSADVLYHLDDDLGALRELRRVLKPGGVLVVNVPAHPWLWSYHDVAVHGRRRYARANLAALLERSAFTTTRITHWNLLPLPLLIARRKLFPPRSPRGSDVGVLPWPGEAFFRALLWPERLWLGAGGSLPAGSSLFAVARRN